MTRMKHGLTAADGQCFAPLAIRGIREIRGERIFARLTRAKLSAPAIPW